MTPFYKFRKRHIAGEWVSYERAERLREAAGCNKLEFCQYLGISDVHYRSCRDENKVMGFRFFAAQNALKVQLLENVLEKLHKITEV